MPDIIDERDDEQIDLQRYFAIARRRHMHILIPLFLGWLVVWSVSWILSPRYRSGTLILVEQPTMPKDYVTPNVTDDLQQRMQSITQQILSRTRLLHIIDGKHLYGNAHASPTPDDQVERMRKDIEIELVRDGQGRVNAFNVYYTARDPRIAQQVTNELTDLFINENLEVRQRQSEDTTEFLEKQLEAARQSLAEQEEKIRQFKGQHVGELPTQLESNLQILSGLQSQLRNEEESLNSAKQQRVYLQSLVSQYRSLRVSEPGDGAPVGLAAVNQELDRLKAQLADLSSHYTERHPDVRKVKDQIAKTQHIRDQMVAEVRSGEKDSAAEASVQSPMLAQLQSQLQSNQIEITNREHAITDLKSRITDYQVRLNQEPVREQQLADLTRGYDQSKATYDELLKKKNESAMATSMELLQQGERFRVLDPPSLPTKPVFPNRLKFCGIGLAVGLALGIFVAAIFEMLDDRLYDEKAIKKLLPVPVTCEIPVIETEVEKRSAHKRLWGRRITSAAVILVMLLGSAFSYLRG
jgi:succinoglycan biosynthesis transport protein ExoP